MQEFDLSTKHILAQLKPHFIFNALTPIQYYLYKGDSKGGLNYLQNLAQLLRQLLDNIREKHITIEKEISFLENYFIVQKQRFNTCFDYKITISDDCSTSELMIPTMMIQPIVENAIEYGIDKEKDDGMIYISFSTSEHTINIHISDNGSGLPDNFQLKPNHALTIINEHIKLIKKKTGIGLFVFGNKDNGAYFHIELPIIKAQKLKIH
jgi:sensor histidine kinase YesM